MNDLKAIFDLPPYSFPAREKRNLLNGLLAELTVHHCTHNREYKKILDSENFDPFSEYQYSAIPFLPVRLFKMFDLYSSRKEDIIKTMVSSGTTGQTVSRIFLDKETSANQTKALTKIVSSFIGKQRIPMLIIDAESTVTNKHFFSARTAGVLGFSIFGSKKTYALTDNMELDLDLVLDFFERHKTERVFLFGFTFMVWKHFYKVLLQKGIQLDLSDSVLIHGGGWKKLQSESVSPAVFKQELKNICGIQKVHDYYGMVEQTGAIYMECEEGYLHAPVYADVIIRRANDFSIAGVNEKGLIQVISVLPGSYPGHSLLTEDEGILLGEDDCACGRLGKYFTVSGRVKNAEIRGCSDVYAVSI